MQSRDGWTEGLPDGRVHASFGRACAPRPQAMLVSNTTRSRELGERLTPLSHSSAAFNLNNPIIDDLNPTEDGCDRILTEKMEIGRRGIELAALGGFEKVTWDGASDCYPSKCESFSSFSF